ncbi:hypothetical protein CVT26_004982 [Gymnopilus dilepis]|uniref:Beta/gamma crystallin 'Greek key' domain-containing protein n=1 Tax=Gymnopilus dilepis TaxID=231916 RepID=A0A409Y036_9AGAR|nr:hypothetical protein CVT26_004982 [Gymnopilus dilepis]
MLSLGVVSAWASKTLRVCTDMNFGGECVSMQYNGHECINLPANINDQISSASTIGNGHSCTLYEDNNCSGATFTLSGPVQFLSSFNDQMSSFKCSS